VNRLKSLIILQTPILQECLQIHERKAPPALQPLQTRLQECFDDMVKHIEKKYKTILKLVTDEILTRELERIQKKRMVQERREELAKEATPIRHSADLVHRSSVSNMLSRGKGSLSSTVSLYSSLPQKVSKSMASIPRPQIIHRKSKQESLDETMSMSSSSGYSSRVFGGSSMSKLTSISGDLETDNPIHLSQTLSSQRPPRAEYRNSLSWNPVPTDNRHSGISISSAQSLSVSLDEAQSSDNSPMENELEVDIIAPPLPPKQRDVIPSVDTKPPTPPPKKPPLRQPKE